MGGVEPMHELIFIVEDAPEGGFIAKALGEPIFTEADDLVGLKAQVRDAVRCHFDEGKVPRTIRLHSAAPTSAARSRQS